MKVKYFIILLVVFFFNLPIYAQNNGKKPVRAKIDLITDCYRIDWVNAKGGKIVIGDKNVSSNAKSRNAKFKSTDIIWWKNDNQAIKVHNIKSHEYERLTRAEMAKYGTKSIYDYYVKKHKLESKGGTDDTNVLYDVELFMVNDTVQIDMHPIDMMEKDKYHYFTLTYVKCVDDSYEIVFIPLTTIINGCLYLTKNDLIAYGIPTSTDSIEFFSLEYNVEDLKKTIINDLRINIKR